MNLYIKSSVIIGVLLISFSLISKPVYPGLEKFASYPSQLNEAVEAISKLPEARLLLENVQSNGKIGITVKSIPGADFTAFWDGEHRVIILNPAKNERVDTQITSILFELHNAAADEQFFKLATKATAGSVDKRAYVRQMEWIEHQNTLKTGRLLKLGQSRGIFPQNIIWKFSPDFNYHFQKQLETGHADWHAKNYDLLVG